MSVPLRKAGEIFRASVTLRLCVENIRSQQ